jgi:hypothetical protein
MKTKILCGMLAIFVVFAAISLSANSQTRRGAKTQRGQVCSDPTQACKTIATFEVYDLPFRIRQQNVIWESEPFYAVILKSMRVGSDNCERFISEKDRLAAQALFPRKKVFANRCTEPASLYYTGINYNARFMAVYAGKTRAEAARMLETVKATGEFPGANIRQMRAGFNGT